MAGEIAPFRLLLFRDSLRGRHPQSFKRHQDLFSLGIELNGEAAEQHSCQRQRDRQLKSLEVPPKGLWECARDPDPGAHSRTASRFVNLSISPAHQPFQMLSQSALGCEAGDAPQVGGGALIKKMESLSFLDGKFALRRTLQPVERLLQSLPVRPLGFDKARKVDNHLFS